MAKLINLKSSLEKELQKENIEENKIKEIINEIILILSEPLNEITLFNHQGI